MSRAERAFLLILVSASALLFAAFFHPFAAPDNDYASFEHVAQALASWSLPDSFKRGPVFPALMAIVAPFAGGVTPYLRAALLINAAASLVNIVLVHAIARRLGGPVAAGMAALLFAGSVQFAPLALQPLVEPTLGTSVLLAALALLVRSRLAYAAAALAALGRTETALLVPLIACSRLGPTLIAELRRPRKDVDLTARGLRRFIEVVLGVGAPRELALSIAALAPLVVWMALGSRFDTGQDTYMAMWRAMDFAAAPSYLERSIREPFIGWYRSGNIGRAVIVAVPLLVGMYASVRRMPWRAGVLFILWILSALAIVRFGVDKARYVYATSWIPMLASAIGIESIARWTTARLSVLPPMLALVPGAFLLVAWIERLQSGLERLAHTELPPIGPEPAPRSLAFATSLGAVSMPSLLFAAFGALLLALAAGVLWARRVRSSATPNASDPPLATRAHSAPRFAAASAALLALFYLTPLLLGGLHGAQNTLINAHYDNYESALGAGWLASHMGDGERAVMLMPPHAHHVAGLDPERVVAYADLGVGPPPSAGAEGEIAPADTADSIAAAMRDLEVTYAIYTWRPPPVNPANHYYYQFYRTDLSDVFADGGVVPGFEHVATIPLPEGVEELEGRRPVQVYRLVDHSASRSIRP